MAQAKRKTEWQADVAAPVAADRAMTAAASPARALQQLLEQQADYGIDEVRWSRRRSVAFIVTTSTALWMALIVFGRGAMAALA